MPDTAAELQRLARAQLGSAGTAAALRTASGDTVTVSWGTLRDGARVRPDTVM